jgi:hypothetical protein
LLDAAGALYGTLVFVVGAYVVVGAYREVVADETPYVADGTLE